MSEKRARKAKRRARRKAKGARARGSSTDRLLAQAARLATASVASIQDALGAEEWASSLLGDWRAQALPDEDPDAVLIPNLVQAFEAIGTAPALACLRALGAIDATGAGPAADRLAESGLPEPEWAAGLGRARPTGAAIIEEPEFDDGVVVVIEFDGSHGLGVEIDHNFGGVARDVVITAPLDEIPAREIGLDEARARVQAALDVLDQVLDPAVGEDVWPLRAMLDARLRLLPDGFDLPDGDVDLDAAEREALADDFLASPEGERWRGDEDAAFVVRCAIDFGADDNHGGPLRWSPTVVEVFMLDWLPREVMAEPELFTRVPEVLPSWVRYAGRRRSVSSVDDAVAAVEEYREGMLNAVTDPDTWSLAEAIAEAAIEAGIDPTDDAALARFMRDRE